MLIKPASSLCNLRCKYCFYHEEARTREVPSYGIMTRETSHTLIDRAFEEASGSVSFAFQGGEPTLAGLDFFNDFCDYADSVNVNKLPISYSIQTNGILCGSDTAWAEFFGKRKFLVGLSVDGTREIHDLNRITPGGDGSYSTVVKAAKNFDRFKVDYNILTVVNSSSVKHIIKIYNTYRKNGWNYMQFIPCLGDDAPDDKAYGTYLCTLFDLWYPDMEKFACGKGPRVSIRQFDDLLNMFLGQAPNTCGTMGICTIQYVSEADGGIYPCDFYCTDDKKLGNLHDMTMRALYESERAQEFIKSSARHPEVCRGCRWYALCRSGCKRYKGADGMYVYCGAFTRFMEHSYERFAKLARLLYSRN